MLIKTGCCYPITIQWKPHYSQYWIGGLNSTSSNSLPPPDVYSSSEPNSSITVFWFAFSGNNGTDDRFLGDDQIGDVPSGGVVDFQIEASIGYSALIPMNDTYPWQGFEENYEWVTVESSGWSNT